MKLLTVLLIFIISTVHCSAQTETLNIEFGETFPQVYLGGKFIGETGDNIVFQSMSVIQLIDKKTLTLVNEISTSPRYKGQGSTLVDAFIFNELLTVIATTIDKKNKKQHYYFHNYSNSGQLKNSRLLLTTDWIKMGMKMAFSTKEREKVSKQLINSSANSFRHVLSENRKNLLIMYRDPITTSENDYKTILLGEALTTISEKNIEIPSEQFSQENFKLTDDGQLILLGYHYEVDDSKEARQKATKIAVSGNFNTDYMKIILKPTQYVLLKYDLKSDAAALRKIIILDQYEIAQIKLKIINNKSLVIYGLSSITVNGQINGFFIGNYEISNSDLNFMTQSDFTEESFENYKKAFKKEEFNVTILLDDIIVKESGEFVLFAEQFKIIMGSGAPMSSGMGNVPAAPGIAIPTKYWVGGIDILEIDISGNLKKQSNIQEIHRSTEQDQLSFVTVLDNDEVHLLVNNVNASTEKRHKIINAYNIDNIDSPLEYNCKYEGKEKIILLSESFMVNNIIYAIYKSPKAQSGFKYGCCRISL